MIKRDDIGRFVFDKFGQIVFDIILDPNRPRSVEDDDTDEY